MGGVGVGGLGGGPVGRCGMTGFMRPFLEGSSPLRRPDIFSGSRSLELSENEADGD